jgi:FKBP-type peptidyl-prolyl cis-trans isomerase 2
MPKGAYDDLTFKIGSGSMIKGFEQSVIGKQVGQTYTVTIPPEQGYGLSSEDLVYNLDAIITVPVVQKYDLETFKKVFPTVDLNNDTRVVHTVWGWPVDIISHDQTSVTIRNLPVYQYTVKVFQWNTTVIDISTERNVIRLQNHLSEITKATRVEITALSAIDPEWFAKTNTITTNKENLGFATASGGVIVIDFNKEVAGKTLVFHITVNSIKRS